MNVKLNDNVLVITGKYAGKQGKVIATSPKTGKVTVQGINIQHKTQKAKRGNDISKIIEVEGPIDVSDVMVVCPACDKATRVRNSVADGKHVRICAKCGAVLDSAYVGKKGKATAAKEAPKKRTRKRAAKTEETPAEEKTEG